MACIFRCHCSGDKTGTLCLPRPDILKIWQELELARDTLAQVQALGHKVAGNVRANSESSTDPEQAIPKKKYTCNQQLAAETPHAGRTENTTGSKARRRATVK